MKILILITNLHIFSIFGLAAHNLTQYQYPPKTKFQLPVPYPWPLKIYTQSYSLPIIKEVDVIVNRMINDLNGDNGDNIAYIRYD